MINVIELPRQPARPIEGMTPKVGHTLFEFMQESRRMPYYAPTVQVNTVTRGTYTDYVPHNPLAKSFAKLLGRAVLTEGQLLLIEEMGMVVEKRLG